MNRGAKSETEREPSESEEVDANGATGVVLHDTYTLGTRIGKGGMGEVYEATHVRLPGRFAVKILRPALLTSQEAIARFCREAEILSALRHPHIVQIFDFNTTPEGLPYFVMEYLEGADLDTRLARFGALSLEASVRIAEAAASALGAAHALDIVHRDLKPANIFLLTGAGQESDFVKVLDFGISKIAASGRRLSHSSVVMGTPEFMSPEQALGLSDQIDARTDQFALGAITYTMLTGCEPFVGDDPASLLYRVVHEPPPRIAAFFSRDMASLQSVLDRALAKRREDRFDSIVDFACCLRTAADSTTMPARRRGQRPAVAKRLDELDRIPHGPQRTVALGLGVLSLAVCIAHSGWSRGLPARAAQLQHSSVSFVRGAWRPQVSHAATLPSQTPPATEIASLPPPPRSLEVPEPSPAPTAPSVEASHDRPLPAEASFRRALHRPARAPRHHPHVYSSEWHSIAIPTHAARSPSDASDALPSPSRFPEPSLTPPPQDIPGFPVAPPTALPPGRDLAPAPQPSTQTRPADDDPLPGP